MKNLIILLLLCCSCNSRIHSGESIIQAISLNYDQYYCNYKTKANANFFNSSFVDSCNKHNIGDTVYIKSK